MRTIDRSSTFRRDYKREAKGQHRATLDANLIPVLMALADDQPLEPRHRDHDLSGEWAGYRDCHVKPDLVLIYRKLDANILRLARLGSHSELFGS
ncbi:MAG: type II toxin-antitoxin system YafQ family toxin [Rhodoferax sp.]|uniref:type II toxin-antitoxin system YafQ family toxin n=1 Tax=Rhodoferax sp. TaxID=50421 RepID=UPI003BB1A474